jgi:hypothetical protein
MNGNTTMTIFLLKTQYGFRERGFMQDGPEEVAKKVQNALKTLEERGNTGETEDSEE